MIVDSHAAIQDSKNLSGSVKAHEVRAVATSLQPFNKVDLHSVMKAGRWSSGGTFTSFYSEISALKPRAYREHSGCLSFGELSGLLPSLKKGGGQEVPKVTRLTEFLSVFACVCRILK